MPDVTRPSTDKLVAAIKAAIGTFGIPSAGQKRILALAAVHHYHDCWSDLATPIIALVADCRAVGWADLAERAIQGEFDATTEEFAEWRRSPEGEKVMSRFIMREPGK